MCPGSFRGEWPDGTCNKMCKTSAETAPMQKSHGAYVKPASLVHLA